MSHQALPARPRPPHRGRQGRRDESGAALLEFSLVFALFVFVLYGLIAFGMMLALKQSVTSAAAEGARSVVGVADDPSTPAVDERVSKAKSTVAQRLGWLGSLYDPADTTATVGTCASSTATCITVTITYPYSTRPLVPPAPGLGLVTPTSFGSTAVVQIT